MTRRSFLALASLLVALVARPVAAQAPALADAPPLLAPARRAAVDRAMEAEMERQKVTGLAVGVIQNGRVAYLKGYGWADRENRVPVTTKTLFRWASVSKPLTAVAALQLAEKGLLDLDADVRTYVPEFPDRGTPVTARQLLCHQGGIVHYANGKVVVTKKEYAAEHPFEDVVTALDRFRESPLLHPPGSKYSYSTYGYVLLSAVVQRAGGQRFADQVRERIVRPLAMTTLQPDYQWLPLPGRAAGYRLKEGKVVPSTDTDVSWKLGGGGYISDIGDLALFATGLIGHALVSEKTETLMWQGQKTADGAATGYGLGFSVDVSPGGRLRVAHNGAQEKAKCRLVIYPREGHGVVVFSNSEHADPGKFSTAVYTALSPAKPGAAIPEAAPGRSF